MKVEYGPAGLLRERIEAGEPCALFASANREHPQRLLALQKAVLTQTFSWNQLSLVSNRNGAWLDLLRDPTLRIGTSTPGCDPSGDYTWAFFDNMDVLEPGLGQQLRARAIPLVGGRDTVKIPSGRTSERLDPSPGTGRSVYRLRALRENAARPTRRALCSYP